jgi:O-antigen/teichoic acid export membrane protein
MSRFTPLKILYPLRGYFRDLFVVFSGSSIAEILPIIITPLLTRIYLPEDFGIYGFVLSIATLLGVFSTLRYENSIIIAKDYEEAHVALRLCEYISYASHFLLILLIIITSRFFLATNDQYITWFMLIPLVSFSSAFLRVQISFATRKSNFKDISKIRILQAISIAFLSATFGLTALIENGLIWALIVGNVIGILLFKLKQKERELIAWQQIMLFFKRHKNFALYSLPAELVNTGTSRYPLLIAPIMFGTEVAGYLTLAYRLVGLPARFISTAVAQVFFQHTSTSARSAQNCRQLFLITSGVLLIISLVGFGSLFMVNDSVFETVLGAKWKNVGEYIRILIPLFAINFIVSPQSSLIYVAEKQSLDLLWQISYFLCILICSLICWWFFETIESVLLTIVLVGSIAYLVYFWIMLMLAENLSKPNQKVSI